MFLLVCIRHTHKYPPLFEQVLVGYLQRFRVGEVITKRLLASLYFRLGSTNIQLVFQELERVSMKSFYEKETYTLDDIDRLIEHGAEESLYLEFKAAKSIHRDSRHEISKDVSAFANADGGVIVYGLTEDNHVAKSIDPIDGLTYTKEWVEDVIASNVNRQIPGLVIHPIRLNLVDLQSIYVVKIPASPDAAHMSKDGRYYIRRNFKAEPLQEYEVRALYERRTMAILEIEDWSIKIDYDKNNHDYVDLEVYVSIVNVGTVVESIFAVNAYIEPLPVYADCMVNKHMFRNHDVIHQGNGRIKFTASSDRPIFPDEEIRGLTFTVSMPIDQLANFCHGRIIRLMVNFSSGMHESEIDLSNRAQDMLDQLAKRTGNLDA